METHDERWLIFRCTAPIGDNHPEITDRMVQGALPAEDQVLHTIDLELPQGLRDPEDSERRIQEAMRTLQQEKRRLQPTKIGIFAIGPIPLLARLGWRLGSQDERIRIFQRLRAPVEGWRWQVEPVFNSALRFPPSPLPPSSAKEVALIVSVSVAVKHEDVCAALVGLNPEIYRIDVDPHDANIISTPAQLRAFQVGYERLLRDINGAHGGDVRLHIFAGVPVSVAVECGRWPLQNAFASIHVYEWQHGRFARGLDMFPPRAVEGRGPVRFVSVTASGTIGRAEPRGNGWDTPAYSAAVTGLLVSETPITYAAWEAVRRACPQDALPSLTGDPTWPVVSVSWQDALRFANALSMIDGRKPAFRFLPDGGVQRTNGDGYRLPLEVEWELAARGPASGPFATREVAPAQTGEPNEHGLYAMIGNIWEWCLDPWEADAYAERHQGVTVDVSGARLVHADGSPAQALHLEKAGAPRVVRGGGADIQASLVDRMTRCFAAPAGNPFLGFRLVGPQRR